MPNAGVNEQVEAPGQTKSKQEEKADSSDSYTLHRCTLIYFCNILMELTRLVESPQPNHQYYTMIQVITQRESFVGSHNRQFLTVSTWRDKMKIVFNKVSTSKYTIPAYSVL